MARWGHFGTPVLVFPTAGGDAEEIERQGLVDACGPLLEAGKIKLYSCDSVAGYAMVTKAGSPSYRCTAATLSNAPRAASATRDRNVDPANSMSAFDFPMRLELPPTSR